MNKLILGIKREYWEYRRVVIGIPVILSILLIMASAMATMYATYEDSENSDLAAVERELEPSISQSDKQAKVPIEDKQESESKAIDRSLPPLTVGQLQAKTSFRFMSVYISLAWLASLYYLLSCLYSDRRDSSVLYWKSLPVSEAQSVATKLIFGSVGFAFVAVLIGWVIYFLLMMLGLGVINSPDGGESWQFIERTMDLSRLLVWPLVAIVVGVIWGAPFFTYALMVSAMSKRLPFMLLILPPIVIAALEGIFLRSHHLIGFFTSHFPFAVLAELADSESITDFLNVFMVEKGASLIVGLVVAAGFIYMAIWYRNNRFEI